MTDRSPPCRFCGAPLTRTFLDLGKTPLANAYVTAADVAAGRDRAYPLHARVCDACLLVQVDEAVPAEAIFSDYAYFSSYSPGWIEHARRYAAAMTERFGLTGASLVVEVASNDGYLLRHFVERGIPVLGVEPAANVAAVARAAGVPTEVVFFHRDSGRDLAARGFKADLMAANNVFAHVPDIKGFAAGFAEVLKPEGVVTFEFPHLLNLIDEVQFDTIYHEHYSYLSLVVVERVLAAVGLRVFDVEELPTHGGSLRVFACHRGAGHGERPGLALVRAKERAAGLDRAAAYDGFAPRVAAVRDGFSAFIARAKAEGRRVAAYGAAAKGNTFLNYCGIAADDILLVADRNPAKQGRLLPGSHIPIVAPEALIEAAPDDLVILPWNVADEVVESMAALKARGCRFWTAVPALRER
ncbi:class I SAM-dependent methyltransferase [Zavarzinia compransoris]|uniref:SAM-dependent methyltransferase n=1 Tax=Zavarzinia compransoris TaxID=1264899 RepID=A0A317E3M4_9PROT|nr:class I SAM-dependent methyltransferase [Zavarzinia compransoris]PWR20800.1 SAM-dependent methyltransferase [Zavarzinia compransoris]TDP44365.1 methyltransferase family protein [Zavarzinia compransoris]